MASIARIQWVVLALAVGAWAAVGWFGWSIMRDAENRSAEVIVVQDSEGKEAAAARLRLIMQDTVSQRAQIDSLLRTHVVTIVDLLEAAGNVGAKVTVSDAHPETTAVPRAISGVTGLSATGFVVEAHGSFSEIMQVVQLLENLPLPSMLGRVQLERDNRAATSTRAELTDWSLSVYVRVFNIPEAKP